MKLILEAAKTIENPSDQEIAALLPTAKLAGIAIEPGSYSYMQFGTSRRRGIELEYQVDSLRNHFKAIDAPITMERVIAAFQKYAKGDASWKTDFQWQRFEVVTIHGREVLVLHEGIKQHAKRLESQSGSVREPPSN